MQGAQSFRKSSHSLEATTVNRKNVQIFFAIFAVVLSVLCG
jgi:hypothetical protein